MTQSFPMVASALPDTTTDNDIGQTTSARPLCVSPVSSRHNLRVVVWIHDPKANIKKLNLSNVLLASRLIVDVQWQTIPDHNFLLATELMFRVWDSRRTVNTILGQAVQTAFSHFFFFLFLDVLTGFRDSFKYLNIFII
jgi:hypothetical protein